MPDGKAAIRKSKRAERMFPSGASGLFESVSHIRAKSACEGKQKFDDPAQARHVMNRVAAKKKARMRVYRCEHCGHYHFGETGW